MRELILSNRRSCGPRIRQRSINDQCEAGTIHTKVIYHEKKDVLFLFYGLMQFQATGDLSIGTPGVL